MNTRFKFRAWDKKTKGMASWEMILRHAWTVVMLYDSLEWEVMQFTGILDKNGKEIYEGDIVRKWCGSEDFCKRNKMTGTVEWHDAGFICTTHDKEIKVKGGTRHNTMQKMWEVHSWMGGHHCLNDGYLEVIGNIYENSDLLK